MRNPQQTATPSIEELYRDDLIQALKNKEDRIVFNDGPIKAGIFMTVLLENAQKSVEIYSDCLNKEVTKTPQFFKSLKHVLSNKDIKVDIILNRPTNNIRVEALLNRYSCSLNNSLVYLKNVSCITEIFGKDHHFTVIDSAFLRKEEDTVNYKATANFSDTELGANVSLFFKSIHTRCTKNTPTSLR